ncbi:16S rRNA (guanine(966)-N(2))-methyltransferase RsmD [Erysipelothrix enhydrae]|uniref:16S rRNA (guanine(966)-N(2))-methyltransferase RsmD n=1 Tax=Erysipelothrix enhydrae TaxID=2890314 RepID=UPI002B24624E|nr:16S rRNA (guanine(966)-N(2))-methyltransferase RsmD [Erysipelothrix sp. 4322-04]WRB86566.1 16S rRNA (guanine(966)-N(2))-methyltransferase RsmD [Erysipelothrix sp. 4322-04]
MRVVAGTFGSRPIKTLKGDTTRPTTDKVRAAIFNRIGPFFNEGAMLDVFGGSGAMAIESISRGIEHGVVFEKDTRAFNVIQDNIKTFGLESCIQLKKGDSMKLLETVSGSFEFVFLDPPYRYEHTLEIIKLIIKRDLVVDGGLIICETDKNYDLPNEIDGYSLDCVKDYGISKVRYYKKDN